MPIRKALSLLLFFLVPISTEAGEWKEEGGIEALHFATSSLTGTLVVRDTRELGKGYGKHGLRDVVFQPTGLYLNAPEGPVGAKRRHQGLLNLYRVYGDGETFGSLRDDLAEATPVESGDSITGARLTWPATEQRPVAVEGVWTITDNRIDVEVVARPQRDIENFEILPATYLPVEMIKGLYLEGDDGESRPVRLVDKADVPPRTNEKGKALYAFHPLNAKARSAQERSGRTTSSWTWPSYVAEAQAGLPLIFAESDDTQVILMSDPKTTSAVCVTPVPEDLSSDPESWNSVQQHSALYFSLFGHDVKAGGEYRACMRLVVVPTPEDGDIEAVHRRCYAEFLD